MIVARAPMRISFAGGGTDLRPYVEDHGGVVVNATISLYAHAKLHHRRSAQLKPIEHYSSRETSSLFDRLIVHCFRRIGVSPLNNIQSALWTDAPPGSGLGASSASVVSLLSAVLRFYNVSISPIDLANLATEIERKDLGIPGGLQDQFAASIGGFNLFRFDGRNNVRCEKLSLPRQTVRDLEEHLLLLDCQLGRHSAGVIEDQLSNYSSDRNDAVAAFHELKACAESAKAALLSASFEELGLILNRDWEAKKRTSKYVTTSFLDKLYAEARNLGVYGGKVSGAGGGGYMLLLCPIERKSQIAAHMEKLGARVEPFAFGSKGVETWIADASGSRLYASSPKSEP